MDGEMVCTADTESVKEFWDAVLKRIKVFVEAARHDSELVIPDRRNCKVVNPESVDPAPNDVGVVAVNLERHLKRLRTELSVICVEFQMAETSLW